MKNKKNLHEYSQKKQLGIDSLFVVKTLEGIDERIRLLKPEDFRKKEEMVEVIVNEG